MRGGTGPRGYTIIEVMIFLAVSGFMFVIAAGFISGKQSTTEFKQGMNAVNSQVQQVINDVGNGFYPSNSNFTCLADDVGSKPTFDTTSTPEQGANKGCVFLGKIVQFDPDSQAADYNVFSIAGRRSVREESSAAPNSFVQAQPKAITDPVDLTDKKTLEWGVTVTGMYDNSSSPATSIGAVGFFNSFNRTGQGGSQTVIAVPVPESSLSQTTQTMIDKINDAQEPGKLDAAIDVNTNILICFVGSTGRFGSLTIGGPSGQRLSTNIRIGGKVADVGCPAS